ncbi:MAG: CPBP family intramembrane metalloprotease [Bacteroidetes bacterium]|nr:MAG: CPBP family intramembrane metalloprotease [Bacteroidota bacterium]
MKAFIKKYPLWSFLILNYLISWTFLYPSYQMILHQGGITPLALLGLIGAYGPSIAAIIVQTVVDKQQLRPLLKKLIHFRAAAATMLFVVWVPIMLYLLAYVGAGIYFSEELKVNWAAGFTHIPFWVLAALPFGPMGEELGWRGFMLPELLKKHSLLKSTLLVGLAWGIWHAASFTFPGAALPDFYELSVWTVAIFIVNTCCLSMVYSYVFLKTSGSVFYAILLHAFFNAAANITYDFLGKSEHTSLLSMAYLLNMAFACALGYVLIRRHQKRRRDTGQQTVDA